VTEGAADGAAQGPRSSPDAVRRLILCMSMSLDGFVARSDGVIDWLAEDRGRIADHGDQRHRITLELLGQIGLIVLGRGAYEDMVQGWPGSDKSDGPAHEHAPEGRLLEEPVSRRLE
jgi:dihydrofolate reductase